MNHLRQGQESTLRGIATLFPCSAPPKRVRNDDPAGMTKLIIPPTFLKKPDL